MFLVCVAAIVLFDRVTGSIFFNKLYLCKVKERRETSEKIKRDRKETETGPKLNRNQKEDTCSLSRSWVLVVLQAGNSGSLTQSKYE